MSNAIDELATLTSDLRSWIEWQNSLGASALPRESVPRAEPIPVVRGDAPQRRALSAPVQTPPAIQHPPAKSPKPRTAEKPVLKAPDSQSASEQKGISAKWKALMEAPTTHRVSGPQNAQVMIVRGSGSSPEAEAMLDRMLENVLGLQRTNVCVVDLHRDARGPAAIGEGFRRALPGLKPTLVIAMGRFAVQALQGAEAVLDDLRGQWLELQFEGGTAALRVTHHPEAILLLSARGQTAPKREAFIDLKAVGERLTSA